MTIRDVIRYLRACSDSYEASAYALLPRENDDAAPRWKWHVRANRLGQAGVLRLIADDIEAQAAQESEKGPADA